MDQNVIKITPLLQKWASSIPCNMHMYLYGSRIDGTYRDDSDLDIAIEIIGKNYFQVFMIVSSAYKDQWEHELNELVPFCVHIQLYLKRDTNEMPFLPANGPYCLIYDSEQELPQTLVLHKATSD